MSKRRIYTDLAYAHFVTFSCYKRRKLLAPDQSKRIVVAALASQLSKHEGHCLGFVVMPNHVHALVWFADPLGISPFMNKWKECSSREIKTLYQTKLPHYWEATGGQDPVWQARYYDFNVYSAEKVEEKIEYMHMNPVRAELVRRAVDWPWSSARWYLDGKSVGVKISAPEGTFT